MNIIQAITLAAEEDNLQVTRQEADEELRVIVKGDEILRVENTDNLIIVKLVKYNPSLEDLKADDWEIY